MSDEVSFEVARKDLAPICKGPHWHPLPDGVGRSLASPLFADLLSRRCQKPDDGRRTSPQDTFPYFFVQTEMAVPLHRLHKAGGHGLEKFSADSVRSLPQYDHRFSYGVVIDSPVSFGSLDHLRHILIEKAQRVFPVIARDLHKFVENSALFFATGPPIAITHSTHKLS